MTAAQRSRRRFARIASTFMGVTLAVRTRAFAAPDDQAHRVVFEVTGDVAEQWDGVLNNVENVRRALGRERTEVRLIAHGKGIGLLRTTNTTLASRIGSLAASGVRFFACENTMKRLTLTKADLLPAVGTVDSGVAEIVRLQEAGWAYLKAGG